MTYVRFRNVGHSTCLLAGYPHVTASEPARPDIAGTRGSFFSSGHSADMTPGAGSTQLGLESDTYCAARPGGGGGGAVYRHFTVNMPGGGIVSLTLPGNGLDLTCGLHLTQFFDANYPQPQPVYPLAALVAKLVLPQTARAGQTLDYEVDLRNPTTHSIGLEPCPEYVEAANSPTPVKNAYALNCTPVATLAAGQTGRFAMRLPISADLPAGPLQIRWGLATPGIIATGTVVITR